MTEQENLAFEKWMRQREDLDPAPNLEKKDGIYNDDDTHSAWVGWRSRAHADSQAPGYCSRCDGEGVIHTGIGEGPTTQCGKCNGTGLAPQPTIAPSVAHRGDSSFQSRVGPWMLDCFGPEIAADRIERNHRFFEEATEAVQANGMTRSEAHQLVDYTFDRPVGELYQEVGGVMVALAAMCLASGQDMHACGELELARIWTKVDQIRAKQAAKPKHSPLPAAPESTEDVTTREERT